MQTITQARSYRATYIPPNIEAEDVEAHHARGLLKTVQLKASDATQAAAAAIWVTGRPVIEVQRVQGAA